MQQGIAVHDNPSCLASQFIKEFDIAQKVFAERLLKAETVLGKLRRSSYPKGKENTGSPVSNRRQYSGKMAW
jgi:hypothetical protein